MVIIISNPLKINEHILDYKLLDYAGHLPDGEVQLNLSLGVNPYSMANLVFERLHVFRQGTDGNEGNYAVIKGYPHDDSVKDILVEWYHSKGVGNGWLTKDNLLLGNGSFDILCNLNLLCLTNSKKVLGHAPQFTAYIDHVNISGSVYDAYYLEKKHNFLFEADQYIKKMIPGYDLFIVENPNNPTGQVIPLADIERIAEKAYSLRTVLIIDEAYGEYMPFENSAINLIPNYPNIIVTRTFSKGIGMAGMRLGYAAAAAPVLNKNRADRNCDNVLAQLDKVLRPFNANGIACALGYAMIDAMLHGDIDPNDPNNRIPYDPFAANIIKQAKREITAIINESNNRFNRSLKIAETDSSTPIMMLYYEDGGEDFDLQEHFMMVGLLTVSCSTYLGLGKHAVRIMLPQYTSLPLLRELIITAIETLPIVETQL